MIFYLDACSTGAFTNLSIEILKMTLGIFKRDFRNKDYGWRQLGYVPQLNKDGSNVLDIIEESEHVNAQDFMMDPEFRRGGAKTVVNDTPDFDPGREKPRKSNRGHDNTPTLPTVPAQDFHKILQTMLASYKVMQDLGGVEWDKLHCGKMYQLQFIPFVMIVKGDGKEHDKHCGQFTSKTGNVGCLCRYCTTPTKKSDQPYFDEGVKRKSQPMIEALIRKNDLTALKAMSQQPFWNAWYELTFGQHNDFGIHGACPIEVLHWIMLGMYKYDRESLFNQTGTDSILGKRLNTIATHIGVLLQRQSDRTLPRTSFPMGVMVGQLRGHEMTGMIVMMTAML